MLVPLRLRLAPGLAVALAVPITVFVWCFTLGPLLEGMAGVSHAFQAAGPFAALVALALALEVPLLSLALVGSGMERRVPLSAMLGLATLPWMLGLMGTEVLMDRVLVSLPRLDTVEAGLVLATSTGEAMAPRLLGAWTSTALLLGLALGLALAHFGPTGFREAAGPRNRGLLLASGVSAALASVAMVGALEARHLLSFLTSLARMPDAERSELIATGLAATANLRALRWTCTGVLAVLGLTLLMARRVGEDAHTPLGWSARLVPATAVAVLLVLDAQPVNSATEHPPVAIPAEHGEGPSGSMPQPPSGDVSPAQPIKMNASIPNPTSNPRASTSSIVMPSPGRTTGGVTSSTTATAAGGTSKTAA
ncbi:hypothetical protein MVI01_48600 [Myxococcus virescens]|uniref:Uncharacterized protein n=1 Tax=Myxococcus virescens TaxID=83456 RepID=A0A511HHM9_9BACT|nr:hypothetical protein [Myxococcus virescens]GEL73076.1 hypothetical protein MVI01_48600 [Myxococcus virescens]SDD43985.1 hypothetical protein SAMN04488504_101891 [Myxococcus virescens]